MAAFVAGVVFVAPSAAFGSGCGDGGTSAVNVYRDCLPSGGGGNAKGAGTASQRQGSSKSATSSHISNKTAKVIRHSGKDGRALAVLVKGSSPTGLQRSSPSESQTSPSAVGSAFDLGSGPIALLIALGGTAVVLFAATGVRGWRRSHRA